MTRNDLVPIAEQLSCDWMGACPAGHVQGLAKALEDAHNFIVEQRLF